MSLISESINELLRLKVENERVSRETAIAGAVQMLAHDVRRPFSILSSVLAQLRAATTPEVLARTLEVLVPEIERSSACVNALVADVIELGREATPYVEAVPPERIIEVCLTEAFRIHPGADVALTYELSHDRDALVDPPRVQRVFANIVANALEAMMGCGRLWFRTRSIQENGQDFVEFIVGNDGPALPANVQSQIFNMHYTRGKRSGTGLGLAIAHRVVLRHGGRIDCGSPSDGRGVEFRFTLPAGPACASIETRAALPLHARWLAPHSAITAKRQLDPALEESLNQRAVATDDAHLPEVAVIDDSRVFLRSWRSLFEGRATSHAFASPEAFLDGLARSLAWFA